MAVTSSFFKMVLTLCGKVRKKNEENDGQLLGWPKSPFSFFSKIKETFFIFTNNFVDLDILSMSAISCYWLLVPRGQGCR